MEWPNGQSINRTDTTPTALAPVVFNNNLILFWKANNQSDRIFYSPSPDGLSWPAGQILDNVDSSLTRSTEPVAYAERTS